MRKKSKWDKGYAKKNKEKTENESPLKIKVHKAPHSFSKAFRKFFNLLPHSPKKRKAVVGWLARAVRLKHKGEMERKLKNTVTTEKTSESH